MTHYSLEMFPYSLGFETTHYSLRLEGSHSGHQAVAPYSLESKMTSHSIELDVTPTAHRLKGLTLDTRLWPPTAWNPK